MHVVGRWEGCTRTTASEPNRLDTSTLEGKSVVSDAGTVVPEPHLPYAVPIGNVVS